MSVNQKGFTLTEVNFAVILSIIILVPFIAYYSAMQGGFIAAQSKVEYTGIARNLIDNMSLEMRRINTITFPAPPAGYDYNPPPDKVISFQYTPYANPDTPAGARTVTYMYDEAREELLYKPDAGADYKTFANQGLIKEFALRYYNNTNTPISFSTPPTAGEIANIKRLQIFAIFDPQSPTLPYLADFGIGNITALTTFNDATKSWGINQWAGGTVSIVKTTYPNLQSQSRKILGNSATQLTVTSNFTTGLENNCKYEIYLSPVIANITAITANTITTNESWQADQWKGGFVSIIDGPAGSGVGQKIGVIAHPLGNVINVAPSLTVGLLPSRCKLYHLAYGGTASAGAAGTLTDDDKKWQVDSWKDATLVLTAGTGVGQTKKITNNTNTIITVDSNFDINPNNTTRYMIVERNYPYCIGIATGGTVTQLSDNGQNWDADEIGPGYVDEWKDAFVSILSGTGAGQANVVSNNTTTNLNLAFTLDTASNSTSRYEIIYTRNNTPVYSGTATGRTSAAPRYLVVPVGTWPFHRFIGGYIEIYDNAGTTRVGIAKIGDNTDSRVYFESDIIIPSTIPAFNPILPDKYRIYLPRTLNAINSINIPFLSITSVECRRRSL